MSEKLVINKSSLESIANAIRTKDGSTSSILVSDMAQKILDIPSGEGGNVFTEGSFVLTEDYDVYNNPFAIEHGLPTTPNVFYLWVDADSAAIINMIVRCSLLPYGALWSRSGAYGASVITSVARCNGSSNLTDEGSGWTYGSVDRVSADDRYVHIGVNISTADKFILRADKLYHWYALTT